MSLSRHKPTTALLTFTMAVMVPLTLMLAACAGAQTEPQPVRSAAGEPEVYMCGRSVMEGWFAHWGDPDEVVRSGFRLIHQSVSSPPDIVDDVKAVADSMPAGDNAALFYKLCFEDFLGGEHDTAVANLAANESYANQVVDYVVNARHRKLIIGNALPKTEGETDEELVWNHESYNGFLSGLQATYPDQVYIFDFYNRLATPEGWLNPAYATGDSHPNNAGYSQLDAPFIALLSQVFPVVAPSISGIAPGTGGLTSPVTINGSSFGGVQGESRVTFGAVDSGRAVSWSDTSIVTCVPVGLAAGAVPVSVETAGGSDTIVFTVDATSVQSRYFAEGYTGSGFAEWLSVGNFGGETAGFVLHYMTADGTVRVFNHLVPGESRASINVNQEVGEGLEVSAILYDSGTLLAERPMYFDYQGRTGGHDATGVTTPAIAWYFAEGYTGPGFDEYVSVLNPQSGIATLTFSFQTEEAGERTFSGITVPAQSRSSFWVNDLLGTGYQTSLALTSDVPVVAERPMYFDYGGWTGGSCVTGINAPATEYYFAEGTTRRGFAEYLTLQNTGASAVSIAADYQFGAGQGTPMNETYVVEAHSRATIPVPSRVGTGKDVSVRLSSSAAFVAERPMYFDYGGWTGGSCVIGATASSTQWSFAEGCTRDGFAEYLTMQNPGETPASVQVTYLTQEAGPLTPQTVSIPAHSRETVLVNVHAGAGYQLSVRLAVTEGPPVVAERPMYFDYNGWDGGHDVVGFPL